MVKRDTQIGKDAVNALHAVITQKIAYIAEIPVDKRESLVVDAIFIGIHVLIEPEQSAFRSKPRHDEPRMPSAAERDIDINPIGMYVQSVDCFGCQGRNMIHLPFLHPFVRDAF